MPQTVVFQIGAPNSGKGYCGTLHELNFQKVVRIVTGDLFRERRKRDPVFDKEYGLKMDEGENLPDEIVWQIFKPVWDQVNRRRDWDTLLVDSILRSVKQVHWAVEEGMLKPGSRVVLFGANRAVCRERNERRSNRSDSHVFEKRFNLSENILPDVSRVAGEYGFRPIYVNANGDIPTEVYPRFLEKIGMQLSKPLVMPGAQRVSQNTPSPLYRRERQRSMAA